MHTGGPHGTVLGEGLLTIATHSTCWEEITTRKTTLTLPTPYCTSCSAPTDYVLTPAPSGCPSIGHIHSARQGLRICLLGDRAVPTENFCNTECLQPQDRKIIIKSLTALMIMEHPCLLSQSYCMAAAPQASDVLHTHVPAQPAGKIPIVNGGTGV